jgi:hypothetical protein
MIERRRAPRRQPDVALQVRDAMTGEVVGHVGNLSLSGLMLVAQAPIADDGLYQLMFHLPDPHGRLHAIEVGAHELWSEASSIRGHHWVGFRFIDIAPDAERMLRDWLAQPGGARF